MSTPSTSTSKIEIAQDRIVIPLATDERCWFKCRQSNAGRLRGQEPMCSLFCYYSNQLPSLITDPTTAFRSRPPTASTSAGPSPDNRSSSSSSSSSSSTVANNDSADSGEDRWDALVRKYTFSYLEGKYLYFATGQPALIRHLASMRQLGAVEHHWLVQKFNEQEQLAALLADEKEKANLPRKQLPEKSHRGLVVLAYHKDYESVINIAHSIASGLASVHGHVEKIYGPSYRMLSKLPGSMEQLLDPSETKVPSQFAVIHGLFTQPLLANSATLLSRAFSSLTEVVGRLSAKYAARLDSNKPDNRRDPRFGGGNSGSPPPPPPPSPPLPPTAT